MVRLILQRMLIFFFDTVFLVFVCSRLSKFGIVDTWQLISLTLGLIYFVAIPYLFNGQTGCMKIFNLKIIDYKGGCLSLGQLFIRFLCMQGAFFIPIEELGVYGNWLAYFEIFPTTLLIMTFFSVVFGKNSVTVWDQITNTRVVISDMPMLDFDRGFYVHKTQMFFIGGISFLLAVIYQMRQ